MGLQKCGLNISSNQKELQPHGTLEFPCAAYESSHENKEADAIPWHWHDELEMVYVREGIIKLQIPTREYHLKTGELAILNTNQLHYAIGSPYGELCSIVFSPFLLTGNSSTAFYLKYIKPLLSCANFTVLKETGQKEIRAFQDAFDALKRDSFGYEFIVREQLSKIMLSCFQKLEGQLYKKDNEKSADTVRVTKMMEFIHGHYMENITLKSISQSADLGERECLRCFKRTIGESPVQYLLKYRLMQSASMLLAKPFGDIAEIASSCGFDYPSYYSKQFKRFYQCTPKDYRRKNSRN